MIKVAINGFGRIGRMLLRALYENNYRQHIQVIAINDLSDVSINAHLLKHDSTHGYFNAEISHEPNCLHINGDEIRMYQEREASKLPWKTLGVDMVLECSGHYTQRAHAAQHISAGAKKVLISAPGDLYMDATVVYGINHHVLSNKHEVISNASCTTNCLAQLVKPLNDVLGIESGLMNTIHAYTNDQSLLDGHHSDLRRARSATCSMIPAKTGAASTVGLVVPELDGKLDGFAIRVPTNNVSVVDFTFQSKRTTSVEEVHDVLKQAAETHQHRILTLNEELLVSTDFNHHSASAIVETHETKVMGQLVKVLAWYDNEWGFANRMLDTTHAWHQVMTQAA